MAKNKFENAVGATNDIRNCYQSGLTALKKNSNKIKLGNNRACDGSVDLDSCLLPLLPASSRWDYCFSYNNEVFFVEVHSAITSEVDTVIHKLNWLVNWLNTNAPEIRKLQATSKHPFYWIQTSRFNILPNSPQHRRVVQAGIRPISVLELP